MVGKFSVLMAMQDGFMLGINHASHQAWSIPNTQDEVKIHLGAVTRVYVPPGCMIIFNGFLFHYGDKDTIRGFEYRSSMCCFAYLQDVNLHVNLRSVQTYHAVDTHTYQMQCDNCYEMREFLKVQKCVKRNVDDMVWKNTHSKQLIANMAQQTTISGDITTLGWVIVKGADVEAACFPGFIWDVNRIIPDLHSTKFGMSTWQQIQGLNHNKPQFPDYVKSKTHALGGKRMMKYKGALGEEEMSKDYPYISEWVNANEGVCANFMANNTAEESKFVFTGHNILVNANSVEEQAMHTDYNPLR